MAQPSLVTEQPLISTLRPEAKIDYPESDGKPMAETDTHRDQMADLRLFDPQSGQYLRTYAEEAEARRAAETQAAEEAQKRRTAEAEIARLRALLEQRKP